MPKELPPYNSSTGLLKDLFKKIQEAPPPARFSQDYLFTSLKFKKSGSTIPFIPFLKRLGFLSPDGVPTEIYKKFRNPDLNVSGKAMAQAIKIAYADLYNRNEYWHSLDKTALKNFLIEVLEVEANSAALKYILSTIETLKSYAVFDIGNNNSIDEEVETFGNDEKETEKEEHSTRKKAVSDFAGLNLAYTINLNLPETSDIKVFDAIFKRLKENLLKK